MYALRTGEKKKLDVVVGIFYSINAEHFVDGNDSFIVQKKKAQVLHTSFTFDSNQRRCTVCVHVSKLFVYCTVQYSIQCLDPF